MILRALLLAASLAALLAPGCPIYAPPVPCTTDADCAQRNPGVRGPYAFPEKGRLP